MTRQVTGHQRYHNLTPIRTARDCSQLRTSNLQQQLALQGSALNVVPHMAPSSLLADRWPQRSPQVVFSPAVTQDNGTGRAHCSPPHGSTSSPAHSLLTSRLSTLPPAAQVSPSAHKAPAGQPSLDRAQTLVSGSPCARHCPIPSRLQHSQYAPEWGSNPQGGRLPLTATTEGSVQTLPGPH
ncbi:hypothetical protein NDU88_003064 [Pleurodeles waltl]|uniref:Uncharacterized protein n=1 Tax=Pleurodeles waltl TaxID=8319 RepID=A0AAV7PBZ3_PLEWA|nr:hypothetical protein NDU88_003064 [Pleurodeles waltl]